MWLALLKQAYRHKRNLLTKNRMNSAVRKTFAKAFVWSTLFGENGYLTLIKKERLT